MFMDLVQSIIPRQQSAKKVRQHSAKQPSEIVRTVMADTQWDRDAAIAQNNLLQLPTVSNGTQM
jgi:hypothetical protein